MLTYIFLIIIKYYIFYNIILFIINYIHNIIRLQEIILNLSLFHTSVYIILYYKSNAWKENR